MKDNPQMAAKLEAQIRQNAGVLGEAMLAGAEEEDKVAGEDVAEPVANDQPSPKSKKAAS